MPNLDAILRQINKDLVPQFEKKLRSDFMKATTELSAQGTWRDPKGAAL